MPSYQRKPLIEFTGEMNTNVSKLLTKDNEVIILANADTEVIGKIKKRGGNTKVGDTLTSSTSTTTSSSTSTSTTTT